MYQASGNISLVPTCAGLMPRPQRCPQLKVAVKMTGPYFILTLLYLSLFN